MVEPVPTERTFVSTANIPVLPIPDPTFTPKSAGVDWNLPAFKRSTTLSAVKPVSTVPNPMIERTLDPTEILPWIVVVIPLKVVVDPMPTISGRPPNGNMVGFSILSVISSPISKSKPSSPAESSNSVCSTYTIVDPVLTDPVKTSIKFAP